MLEISNRRPRRHSQRADPVGRRLAHRALSLGPLGADTCIDNFRLQQSATLHPADLLRRHTFHIDSTSHLSSIEHLASAHPRRFLRRLVHLARTYNPRTQPPTANICRADALGPLVYVHRLDPLLDNGQRQRSLTSFRLAHVDVYLVPLLLHGALDERRHRTVTGLEREGAEAAQGQGEGAVGEGVRRRERAARVQGFEHVSRARVLGSGAEGVLE